MKITDVEVICLRLPEVQERCDGTQDTLIVKVYTDEGIVGLGEIDTPPTVGAATILAPFSHTMATGLRNVLIGKDPFEVEKIWDEMYWRTIYFGRYGPVLHAMSGIDMALWDIVGKSLNRPVYQLLGGAFRKTIPVYASALMPDTPEEAAELAERFAEMGYKAVKFGWGPIGRCEQLDMELVRAIRRALGSSVRLMIDAGLAWDRKTALRMANKYAEYDVFWLEEPLPPDDLEGYALLAEHAPMYIAAGEQESGRKAFRRLIEEGRIDIVQPDLARCGGLTEAKRIGYMAYDRNTKLVPHAFKSGISVAACAHLVASLPNGFMLEYTMSESPIARDLVHTPVRLQNGCVEVPEGPGLGVDLDEDVVKRYRDL
ncbi:MAG: mandelate racemase/muconate lactonizing enzyme family protein [Alicyclobacillus sp.]|nr:mandelate racemase/muconate lactonizing enzyme family protein [Alicyclobacillus sp.]